MRPSRRAVLATVGAVLPLGAAVVLLAYGPWAMGSPPEPDTGAGTREIAVRVHAWGFSPRVVRVKPGQTVRFLALSEDIGHGFAINELGVNLPLRPGRVARSQDVSVNLPEGTYAIHCSVFCGLGHPSMKGKLVVGTPRPTPGQAMPWVASLLTVAAVAGFVMLGGAVRGRRG